MYTYTITGMYFGTDLDDIAAKKQQQQADASSSSTLYDITDDVDDDILSVIGTTNTPVSLPRLTTQSRLELEVTYEVFLALYWPKMVSKFNSMSDTVMKLDPSLVWTEIRSHIKGSTDALSSPGKLHILYTMLNCYYNVYVEWKSCVCMHALACSKRSLLCKRTQSIVS